MFCEEAITFLEQRRKLIPIVCFCVRSLTKTRATQESEGALARIRDAISMEKEKPRNQVDELEIRTRFVDLLHKRFNINPQRAKALFEVLQEDAE